MHQSLNGAGHERGLALAQLLPDGSGVKTSLFDRRKHFVFLFLDVVVDVLAKHLHLRVVVILVGLPGLDLGDEILGALMLDIRFVD